MLDAVRVFILLVLKGLCLFDVAVFVNGVFC